MICTLSKHEAERQGYSESLMLDHEGNVAEGTSANIFFKDEKGDLHTPIADSFLNGITRQTVIEIAKSKNIGVHERKIKPEELSTFVGCFLTGTAAEITPVSQIAENKYKVCDRILDLSESYGKLVRKKNLDIFSSISTSDTAYAFFDGTSMSGPHVAGVLALMQGLQPDWSVLQMREKLLESVDPLPSFEGLVSTGGRVNAFKAVSGMEGAAGLPDGNMEVSINPGSGSVLLADTDVEIHVRVIDGAPVTDAVVIGILDDGTELSCEFVVSDGAAVRYVGEGAISVNDGQATACTVVRSDSDSDTQAG